MEINSAHVYFRSRIMLCFDDENRKIKHIQRQEPVRIFYVLKVMFIIIVPCTCDVSSVLIFHIQIE